MLNENLLTGTCAASTCCLQVRKADKLDQDSLTPACIRAITVTTYICAATVCAD
jgi:hypothetical protein